MKKRILVGILCLVLTLAMLPMTASAATTDTIQITATGSEINISIDTASWAIGYVYEDTIYQTGITSSWATLTNNGAEAVDVTVFAYDMKDDSTGTHSWDCADDGNNGADVFAMYAGNDDGDDTYDTIIKEYLSTPYNQLIDELASSGTQDFGLQFESPSTMSYYEAMTMVGSSGTTGDADRGVTFTGSVD